MENSYKINQIVDLIRNANTIAVMPSKVAELDGFAAGVGLYLILKNLDKKVTLIYPGKHPEGFEQIISEPEITKNINQRELLVSIDYSDTPASKVHYSTENDVLNLRISPVNKDFDFKKVQTTMTGFDFDLVITIGAQLPEDFGRTYENLKEELSQAKIINLDNTDMNQRFGTINVVDASEDSLSLLVLNNAIKWGYKPSTKAARALLKGISHRDS